MIRIAIDGPGGAGKSTVAKEVAKRLGIIYVDTGALYRTIGLWMLRHGVDPKSSDEVVSSLGHFTLELKYIDGRQVILLDGEDVGDSIRTPEVSMAASAVSAIPEVRSYLLDMQRGLAKENSLIMDGRDIGTVIIPDAEVKIFLTAKPEVRANRRYLELRSRGSDTTYEAVLAEMNERDKNDAERAIAPCVKADDAFLLDNSDIDFDGTVDIIIKRVRKCEESLEEQKRKHTAYMKTYRWMAPLVRWIFHVKIRGAENIPSDGGVIVCANHVAIRDVFVIASGMNRPLNYLAKKELFKVPFIGRLMKKCGAVSIDRGGNDVAALKTAIELAREGCAVAIFPQGHRNPGVNPVDTVIHNGAGLIAYRSGKDVLPVCIKLKKFKYAPFRRVEVIFGKVIKHSELGFTSGGNEEYRAATEKIFDEIVRLGGYDRLPSKKYGEGGRQ